MPLENFMTPCVKLIETLWDDGMGGAKITYKEGETFSSAIALSSGTKTRQGEKQGVTSQYNVMVENGVNLKFQDIFKRKADGGVFRVTSDSVSPPVLSSLECYQISAETWEV